MNVLEVKRIARKWVEVNRENWTGLRAAHLVGGINAMPDEAEFPSTKDVDLHVIFEMGSPQLQQTGPFAHLFAESYSGILIEAGPKPVSDYQTKEAILANPEIAHHLTIDSTLYDPNGWLRALHQQVAREYAKREWVQARVDFDRNGFFGILGMRPMAGQMLGPSGEANILGYSCTRVAAALTVAALKPLKVGGRSLVGMRQSLAEQNRLDLHERFLAVLGLRDFAAAEAQALLDEAVGMFDLAVVMRRAPHPFQHKMHAHMRPYFIDSCQGMIDEGYPREASGWTAALYLASTDILKVDGPENDRATYAERADRLLARFGFDTVERRDERFSDAERLGIELFALADEIVATNPAVVD
jgi:hypothetical protein